MAAVKLFGLNNFGVVILEIVPDILNKQDNISFLNSEQSYILKFKPTYNIRNYVINTFRPFNKYRISLISGKLFKSPDNIYVNYIEIISEYNVAKFIKCHPIIVFRAINNNKKILNKWIITGVN
jgi:hypothetical protein